MLLTFLAHTEEEVGEENRTFFFTDARKVRRFRINYDLERDSISVDEYLHELRAVEGNRVERARWRPFLRKAEQDGGQTNLRVPKATAGDEFHLHRNVGAQSVRATTQDAALDPGWKSERVDKVNLRIHWPPERGAARRAYVQLGDFAIGREVTLFGRTFHIDDASAETRAFFAQSGAPLPPARTVPEDDYLARQEAVLAAEQARRTAAAQADGDDPDFLENLRRLRAAPMPATREHRAQRGVRQAATGPPAAPASRAPPQHAAQAEGRVLRFWLRPDATATPDLPGHGRGGPAAVRTVLLRYGLEAKGEGARPELLELLELHGGGHLAADAPVLLRAGRGWCERREMTVGGERPNAPAPAELRVGGWAFLGGRRYFVLACDAQTRAWLAQQPAAGAAEAMPPNFALDYEPRARPPGADARPDGVARRRGFDAVVRPSPAVRAGVPPESAPTLRFLARLADAEPAQHSLPRAPELRTFAISVPPDLRLSVRELPAANSGRKGGLVVRPPLPTEPVGHGLARGDFCVGRTVRLGGLRLLLFDAEEATLAAQERDPDVFPESDVRRILASRARPLAEQLRSRALAWARGADGRLEGVVDLDGLLRLLRAASTPPFDPLAGLSLAEAVALFRAFREPGRELVDLAILQRALERSAESLEPGHAERAVE